MKRYTVVKKMLNLLTDSDVLIFLGREYLFIRWLCSFLFGG